MHLLGTAATAIAIICVADVGYQFLTGRVPTRHAITVIWGCFILFGAPGIAAALGALASGRTEADTSERVAPLPAAHVSRARAGCSNALRVAGGEGRILSARCNGCPGWRSSPPCAPVSPECHPGPRCRPGRDRPSPTRASHCRSAPARRCRSCGARWRSRRGYSARREIGKSPSAASAAMNRSPITSQRLAVNQEASPLWL